MSDRLGITLRLVARLTRKPAPWARVTLRITLLVGDRFGERLSHTFDGMTQLVGAVAESLGLGNGFCYS